MTLEYPPILAADRTKPRHQRAIDPTTAPPPRLPFVFDDLETHYDPDLNTL